MPEIINLLILAATQGLTEFLPVSSSGHLVLLQHFLATREGDVFFDVLLHVGTLGSVIVVYRRELLRLLRLDRAAVAYVVALGVGTIPAVFAGLLFKDFFEGLYQKPIYPAAALLVTAALLFSTRYARGGRAPARAEWEPRPPHLGKAFLIGCAQAAAICPGISRSGSTIAASLWLGLVREEAARFSFLLAVPAILGALVLNLVDGVTATGADTVPFALSALTAFLVGLVAIRLTALAVVQAHFWKFGFYCVAVGLASLLLLVF
ncbi:MAG: undecaprenyl-diphosphate phosphatase [Candidatus Krumholzibacteriia bacterium]